MRTIIVILLITNSVFGQKARNFANFEQEIVTKLREYGEIDSEKASDPSISKQLYNRLLFSQSKIEIYEIGLHDNHSYKYIAIWDDKKLSILESKNFDKDFVFIIETLKKAKCSRKALTVLIDIRKIYNYNTNPPWGLEWEVKKTP